MSAQEEKERKARLIAAIDSPRYGPRTLRALCVIALDIHKLNSMSDADLLRIPGVGVKSLNGIRSHLREYFSEEQS